MKIGVDTTSIEDLKLKRKAQYSKVVKVYCPALREAVFFNNHGFKHLMYDGNGRRRKNADIIMRLNLLPCAPVVVSKARSIANARVMDSTNAEGKEISFYELQYGIRSKLNPLALTQVVVILRRIGDGKLHFFSIRYGKRLKTK